MRLDLSTGDRETLTHARNDPGPPLRSPRELVLARNGAYAVVLEWNDCSLIAVDLVTGHRVYIAR